MTSRILTNVSGAFCTSCGSKEHVLNRHEELVCTKCGQVIMRQNLEEGPEWRPFLPESESRSRVGIPTTPLLRDKGMSTFIGLDKHDLRGRRVTGRFAKDIVRLRKWQHRLRVEDTKQRNLSTALKLLNRMGERLELPFPLLERASHIYRKALERDLIRGRSIGGLIAASLYVALRSDNLPWSLRDVSHASGYEKGEVSKWYRLLVQELGLEMPLIDAVPFVRRICAQLNLERKVDLTASRILRMAQEKRLTGGKSPVASAAGAIYYACRVLGVELAESAIAKTAGTTEVTIKNHFEQFKEKIEPMTPIATLVR
ncbi:MAG: transcription initiation factor IIB family protein [Candidatus Geothermarchaeales archaeon]